MEREEEHRNRWAIGLSVTLSIFILLSFAFYKGYLSLGASSTVAEKRYSEQLANVVSAEAAPSPIESSKETFISILGDMNQKYREFKETISAVLVPFVTGIEVYERK